MSTTLQRLRELAGLKAGIVEAKPALSTSIKADEPEDISYDDMQLSTTDADSGSTDTATADLTAVDKVKTAADDIAKAKVHIKNIQKLADTIRNDINKYVTKIEKHVMQEFGGMSNLGDIDPESAKKIRSYFNKLHDIANSK